MTPADQAALENTIVTVCSAYKKAHWKDIDYRPSISIGEAYFVKFGNPRTLEPEVATQKYISAHDESQPKMPGTPRIPKVLFDFRHQHTMYMVMEYIQLSDSPPETQRIVDALRWLSAVPLPPNHVLGPLAGGHIRHRFFKEDEAPLDFQSVKALERYIEKGRNMLSKAAPKKLKPVSFSGERLMFTQSDTTLSNFGIDEHGDTVLMDFGDVGVLPESFAAFTCFTPIVESLCLSKSNGYSLAVISSVLWMTADEKLGLNNNGYPKDT